MIIICGEKSQSSYAKERLCFPIKFDSLKVRFKSAGLPGVTRILMETLIHKLVRRACFPVFHVGRSGPTHDVCNGNGFTFVFVTSCNLSNKHCVYIVCPITSRNTQWPGLSFSVDVLLKPKTPVCRLLSNSLILRKISARR